MPRVDFYVLSDDVTDARLRYACRLAEKAVELGHRVFVRLNSPAEAERLDELLWTFNDRSFLPHAIWQEGDAAPHASVKILMGVAASPPTHRELLINLAEQLPGDLDSFERVAEIVDVDPERRRTSRERYKQYRERGCTLETHTLAGG